jgi:hypothetical protein
LRIFFFFSNSFSSLGDPASIDFTSQSGGSAVRRHLSSDVPAKKDKCSSVFLNMGCENDSGSYCHNQQIPGYNNDRSDSFIVFEPSAGQELENEVDDDCDSKHSCDDGIDIENSNRGTGADVSSRTSSEASSKCLSAWSEEIKRKRTSSTNECHETKMNIGHKRTLSLDISSGGGVVSPPKPSRVYLFIQMQLCRRESLKEWLRDEPDRSTDTVLQMFDQIVQAVEYVHVKGLIHRDLKVRIFHCECTWCCFVSFIACSIIQGRPAAWYTHCQGLIHRDMKARTVCCLCMH